MKSVPVAPLRESTITKITSMAFPLFPLLILLFSTQQRYHVSAKLSLEEGYTVTTVLDANKLSKRIKPSSILPRLTGGFSDVVVLDSPNSLFYTIPFPISQESGVRRYSGNETSGFADGDLGSARFDRPRSFAVDMKGNVYVADKTNHAIRKITKSGVTTVAGGHSGKPGKADGPAQYASFSEDFELAFVPEACALLISDSGNRLIRLMNLKPDDCGSRSPWQLGVSGSILLGATCVLLGSAITVAIGLLAFPSMTIREVMSNHNLTKTLKHCYYQTNLERVVTTIYYDIKSVVVRIVTMSLSHLSPMFSVVFVHKRQQEVSFLPERSEREVFVDQLKDLMSYDERLERVGDKQDEDGMSSGGGGIDDLIKANLLEFGKQSMKKELLEGNLGLVKRK